MRAKSVLVVEDDVTINETLRAILDIEGYDVRCVTNLGAARLALATAMPSVILLDLMLNDTETGETLLEELVGREGVPSVVVVSASPHATSVAARYHVELVAKPFDVDDLLDALARGITEVRPPALKS